MERKLTLDILNSNVHTGSDFEGLVPRLGSNLGMRLLAIVSVGWIHLQGACILFAFYPNISLIPGPVQTSLGMRLSQKY